MLVLLRGKQVVVVGGGGWWAVDGWDIITLQVWARGMVGWVCAGGVKGVGG